MIKLNDEYTHAFSFTQKDVENFAEVSGDKNPIHLDEAYAATTRFKKPIVHGMLGAAVFSKILGTAFPGEGTIYMKQSLAFTKPMYIGVEFVAKFVVKDINYEKGRATIATEIVEKVSGDVVISGEAFIMNTDKIKIN